MLVAGRPRPDGESIAHARRGGRQPLRFLLGQRFDVCQLKLQLAVPETLGQLVLLGQLFIDVCGNRKPVAAVVGRPAEHNYFNHLAVENAV